MSWEEVWGIKRGDLVGRKLSCLRNKGIPTAKLRIIVSLSPEKTAQTVNTSILRKQAWPLPT